MEALIFGACILGGYQLHLICVRPLLTSLGVL